MAAGILVVEEAPKPSSNENTCVPPTLSSYIGLSFAIFLGFLPRCSISLVSCLQSRNRALSLKLIQAEEQLRQMKSRRKEDSKANARVVEIFASHRNGWQQEEKRLLQQIQASAQQIAHLRARIDDLEKSQAELQREVEEREEMINFMSRRRSNQDDEDFAVRSVEKLQVNNESDGFYATYTNFLDCSRSLHEMRVSSDPVPEEGFMDGDGDGDGDGDASETETASLFGPQNAGDFFSYASTDWQDIRCDSLESSYQTKHFVARRESPWKVDGESTGVPSKLKLLEQELMNLEKIDKGELSKVPSLLRKQAKRYQALAGKIDDLCRKMRANDPSEPSLRSELRIRHQTEFLIEASRLQQRAIETGQKLTALQSETAKSNFSNDVESHAKLSTRRSLDCIRNNLREIQRSLEVWVARIMGDLEGILAKDGTSGVTEYYMSRYPFVQ